MKKRILSLLLITCLLGSLLLQLVPSASAAIFSGTCGDNLVWTYDTESDVMEISGSGDMTNWNNFGDTPWFGFYDSITTVEIAQGVTSIGDWAFCSCASLASVIISDSVASIGEYAFLGCDSLTGIWVDDESDYYCSDTNGVLFNKEKTELLQCPGGYSGAYTVPDSVTSIGNDAFYGCASLTSVTIPHSVTSIGRATFDFCTSLTCVTIPDGVTSIGDMVFNYCTSLTSVAIPNSVTSIGSFAFCNCTSLTSVTIPNSVTSIGSHAFNSCTSLARVTIPNNVTSIGGWAFCDCASLMSVTVLNASCSIDGGKYTLGIPMRTVLYGCPSSTTQVYAEENGYTFCSIDAVSNPFTDIQENAYYYDSVLWAVQHGITYGTSETMFSPEDFSTRAQVVSFLYRAAGSPEPKLTTSSFDDVSPSDYYYKAVMWAVEKGITAGTSETTFSPEQPCTRAQVAAFLWRMHEEPASAATTNPFADVNGKAYYYDAVLWAVENGITYGTGEGKFSPEDTCTRGQIVSFLYRALAD